MKMGLGFELGCLSHSINKMIKSIFKLIEYNYESFESFFVKKLNIK